MVDRTKDDVVSCNQANTVSRSTRSQTPRTHRTTKNTVFAETEIAPDGGTRDPAPQKMRTAERALLSRVPSSRTSRRLAKAWRNKSGGYKIASRRLSHVHAVISPLPSAPAFSLVDAYFRASGRRRGMCDVGHLCFAGSRLWPILPMRQVLGRHAAGRGREQNRCPSPCPLSRESQIQRAAVTGRCYGDLLC